jgi:TonB-dependent starch-binding outer membrane protein SusC
MKSQLKISSLLGLLVVAITLFFTGEVFAQQKVTGKVTGYGEGLIGATVSVKGTTNGTVTDIDGNYAITVKDGKSVIVFSYTGFASQEEIVGTRSSIDVQLKDGLDLNQVVVIGYGTQRKADLTGSVASVSAKEINGRPITSLDQAIGGRASGVHIANRSGDPGAPIEVRIRGVGTAGNNKPLWVIDGIAVELTSNATVNTASYSENNPLAGINPADIESIDVLKDNSAAAIYGSRAMNGVIIVTTKRGKEGKTIATYDGYYGISSVPNSRRLDVLGVDDYVTLQTELGRGADVAAGKGKPAFDWQDAIFEPSSIQSNNLSISGGTKNVSYSFGAGNHSQGGVETGQGFKRISVRANTDVQANKYLKFGESLIISSTDRKLQSEGGNFAGFASALNAPYYQGYDANDVTGYNPILGNGATSSNYLWLTDTKYNDTRVVNRKILGSVYGEFEPVSGLKFKSVFGGDYTVSNGYFFQNSSVKNYGGGGSRSSLLVQERPIELLTNWTNTATYNFNVGKSNIMVLGGYEEVSFRYDKLRLQGNNLVSPSVQLASKAGSVSGSNEAGNWALRSLFGRVNYSFNDRYLLQANLRRDQSSRFAPGKRTKVFPSFSAGWRLSEESFFAGVKEGGTVDYIKLRASWGQLGNQNSSGEFPYLQTLGLNTFYALGNTVVRGPAPITFANGDLSWETSTQIDFGFDAGLFNNHLDVTFDYFNKKSKDVLLSLPLPMSSGYFLPADANIGSIGNKGIELGLTWNNRTTSGFRYSVGGNITTTKNEVLDLGTIPYIVSGVGGAQSHRTEVGAPLGFLWGYQTDGIYQTQAEVDARVIEDGVSPSPGDIRFVDVNKDGKITSADKTNIGSSIPKYYYGGNLSMDYKGIDLSLFIQGVGKYSVYNQARQGLEDMKGGNNQLTSVLNRWTPSNPSNDMPRATASDPNSNNRFSDRWVENAAFMRLKNVQLGYTIPAGKAGSATKNFLSGARVYVSVQNLATFTKYKGLDPEVTRGNSFQKGEFSLANGQDSGGSPQPTITQFGLQLNF